MTPPAPPEAGRRAAADSALAAELRRARGRELALEARLAAQTLETEQLRADLDAFASSVSHDLTEPVRMVSSYLGLISRRYAGRLDADADEFIDFAVDGSRRLVRMIADLVQYARIGTRGRELAPTDTGRLVQEAIEAATTAIERTGAAVSVGPLPTLLADEAQLSRLFRVLLDNALTYRGEDPPRIEVQAAREGSAWVFAVRDNGAGFEMAQAERVFGICQRLHTRGEYPGSGMGLAIARRIVQRHGGRIWAEAAPGKGATFRFTLRA
jgi:light-regulated signal transduction histidine kinase (bacteriophytochrome)